MSKWISNLRAGCADFSQLLLQVVQSPLIEVHVVQYVSVIAWVFEFRKFITITDVSLQAMYIPCAPIASIWSQHVLTHERYTKYLVPCREE